MRTMAMLDAPPRSDSIWPMNALSLPSSMFVVDMDVPPSKSYSLNAVEYTRVGSVIMPAETLARVLAEQLHPAAQVKPGIGEFEYAPNWPQTQSGSMSQMGQTRTSASLNGILPSTADVVGPPQHVRFVPQT